jgi:hypothetical protein
MQPGRDLRLDGHGILHPTAVVTTTSRHVDDCTTTTTTPAPRPRCRARRRACLLEGNWADGPLITTEFGALGWWDGGEWLDAETQGALPVVGGEDYQVSRLGFLGMTTAGPQTTVCEPLELLGVDLADPELLGSLPGPYGVAISAAWVLQPHIVEETTDGGDYAAFAAEILADRGLDVDRPVIKQLIRTDLDGDGVNEVLVVAEEVTPGFLLEPGDYSIVLMRKVIDEGRTALLDETIVLDERPRGEVSARSVPSRTQR